MDVCFAACNASSSCASECLEPSRSGGSKIDAATLIGSLCLLLMSGFFSGLTLGLLSLNLEDLEIIIQGGDEAQARLARRILPIRRHGNLLLCTLLLGNTLVNALISILTAQMTSGLVGGFVATGVIVIFGEIIPQACDRPGDRRYARTT